MQGEAGDLPDPVRDEFGLTDTWVTSMQRRIDRLVTMEMARVATAVGGEAVGRDLDDDDDDDDEDDEDDDEDEERESCLETSRRCRPPCTVIEVDSSIGR